RLLPPLPPPARPRHPRRQPGPRARSWARRARPRPMNPHRVLWVLDSLQLVALQPPPGRAALQALWGRELETVAGGVHQLGMRSLHDLASWRQLAARVRQWQPAIIHTHLRYATIWGAAARGRVPQVVTVHLGPSPETGPGQKAAAWLERRARCRAARVLYVSQA